MRGFQAASFTLSDKTETILKNFSTSYSLPSCIVLQSKIILMAAEEKNNTQIAKALGTTYSTVSIWRNRFYNSIDLIAQTEEYDDPDGEKKLSDVIKSVLSYKQRLGKEPVFSPEQIMPFLSQVYRGSLNLRGSHHGKTVTGSTPQKSTITRNPLKKIETICGIYLQAAELAECGTEVYSTDEMTGIQALERKYPDKSVRPGSPALYEFEYIRHGTISLITFLRIADGRILSPYLNNTRNEEDFCNAVR